MRDRFRRVNVADYYIFTASHHNNLHPGMLETHIVTFQDDLTTRRRNEMHKRIISDVLMDRVPELYGEITFSQARLKEWKRMKDLVEEISNIPEFELYKKHSKNCWMVKRLIDQRMETRCRAKRQARKKKNERNQDPISVDDSRLAASNDNHDTGEGEHDQKDMVRDKPQGGLRPVALDEKRADVNEMARTGPAVPYVPDLQHQEDIDDVGNEQLSAIPTGSDLDTNVDPVAAERARIKNLRAELSRLESMIACKESPADAERTNTRGNSTKRKPSIRGRNNSVKKKRCR